MVLTIIAVVAGLVSPYARGSFGGRRLREAALTFREHVKYAEALAVDRLRPTRLYVDMAEQRYRVEIATDVAGQDFGPAAGPAGEYTYMPAGVEAGGMELAAGSTRTDTLLFVPDEMWTVGQVRLSDGQGSVLVKIGEGLGCVQVVGAE